MTSLDDRTVRASVARLDDLEPGTMKMVSVGETRVALIRTATGIYALDNSCPHQGYGLVTGALDGDTLTCQWHNWKFDVTTGRCLMGEEDVACHRVVTDGDDVAVEVELPSDAERRQRLWPSLRRGVDDHYVGQIARDSVRLLEAGATPAEIMADAVARTAPRADYGVGHELAMAADCLALAEVRTGDDRALALVQGLAGLSEVTRDRPAAAVPPADPTADLVVAIEAEDARSAVGSVMADLERGADPAVVRHRFVQAASAHHLSYGHGIIYTQKSFEALDRLGWAAAPSILPHLATRLVNSTREDLLPYMRPAMRAIETVDLDRLAAADPRSDPSWLTPERVGSLLAADAAPIDDAVHLAADGGVEGLLDAVTAAVSHRLLAHDLDVELDVGDPFGWLDITHGLTTAQAARWAWRADPGPHTARLALFATWLLFDTGRSERRRGVHDRWHDPARATIEAELDAIDRPGDPAEQRPSPSVGAIARPGDTTTSTGVVAEPMAKAVAYRRPSDAVALAAEQPLDVVGDALASAALQDRAGSFIVVAHLVKTVQAARAEADVLGSPLPLMAAARFVASPRLERFVARNVNESLDFVRTGRPPRR